MVLRTHTPAHQSSKVSKDSQMVMEDEKKKTERERELKNCRSLALVGNNNYRLKDNLKKQEDISQIFTFGANERRGGFFSSSLSPLTTFFFFLFDSRPPVSVWSGLILMSFSLIMFPDV